MGVQFNQFIANTSLFFARIFSVDKKGIRRKDILVRRPRQMFYHLEWPLYRANKYTGDHNWIYLFYVFHFMPVETNRICGLSDPDRMLVIRVILRAGTSSVLLCIHNIAPTTMAPCKEERTNATSHHLTIVLNREWGQWCMGRMGWVTYM